MKSNIASGGFSGISLGVEPGMLAAVALIHMVEDMKRPEGDYGQQGQHGLSTDDRQDTATVEPAVLITSNICLPTACVILQREAKLGGSDAGRAQAIVPTLVDKPRLRDEIERLTGRSRPRFMSDAAPHYRALCLFR